MTDIFEMLSENIRCNKRDRKPKFNGVIKSENIVLFQPKMEAWRLSEK